MAVIGQNLIPDPSVENVAECPSSLGEIETYTDSSWLGFRGSPDYWHSCSVLSQLGWDNSIGFQEPLTGQGYLGLVTFDRNLNNVREYLGATLLSPLEIGMTYYVSFNVSRAHKSNGFNVASNNIGALLMKENYLDTDELGVIPNQSHYNLDELLVDTVNWVNLSFELVADSAYNHIAFGNFYDDSQTDTLRIGGEPTGAVTAYYYFDDFCITTNPNGCENINSAVFSNKQIIAELWPNPSSREINIRSEALINGISIYDLHGRMVMSKGYADRVELRFQPELNSGIYILKIFTEKGIVRKRFMVSN
jgi:hypothetical protein